MSTSQHISEFVTVSDEAFALLLVENSWDVWMQMAEKARKGEVIGSAKSGIISDGGSGLLTKFTTNGAHVRKHGGWSKEGLKRFVELVDEVQTDRNANNTADKTKTSFEKEYIAEKKGAVKNKKRKCEQENINAAAEDNDGSDEGDFMYFEL
jgi:hypothetical protein